MHVSTIFEIWPQIYPCVTPIGEGEYCPKNLGLRLEGLRLEGLRLEGSTNHLTMKQTCLPFPYRSVVTREQGSKDVGHFVMASRSTKSSDNETNLFTRVSKIKTSPWFSSFYLISMGPIFSHPFIFIFPHFGPPRVGEGRRYLLKASETLQRIEKQRHV